MQNRAYRKEKETQTFEEVRVTAILRRCTGVTFR